MSVYPLDSYSRYRGIQRQSASQGLAPSGASAYCSQGASQNYFQNFNSGGECDTFESPKTQLIAPDESARMWGDPHIEEADSGKYDFNEKGVFNLLEDSGVSVNARLDGKEGEPTYIKKAGLVVNDRKIRIDGDGKVMINKGENGQDIELKDGETRQLGNGSYITKNGDAVNVGTPEYKMEFKTKQGNADSPHMDVKVLTKDGGVALDGKKPSGLLGETFDKDKAQQTKPNQEADYYKRDNLFESRQPYTEQPETEQSGTENPESENPADSFQSPDAGCPPTGGQGGCNGSSGPSRGGCGNNNGMPDPAAMQGIINQLKQILQQLQQAFGGSSSASSNSDETSAQGFS